MLGIKHEDAFIPFLTDVTTIYFDTRVPTKEERAECSWLIMTGDTEWDPSSVPLQAIQTKEEEEFRAISEIARANKPPLLTHKLDIHLGGISDWLVEQTMTERLIASVNIKGVNKLKPREEQKPLLPNHYSIRVSEIASKTRHSVHSPEEVSRKFNIGIERAKETLKVTTQKGIRHAVHPLHRRYRFNHMQFNRKSLNEQFYCYHLVAKTKSLDSNTGAWLYTTGKFTLFYPCGSRREAGDTLRRFANNVGIPDQVRSDLAPELTGKNTEFQAQAKRLGIDVAHSESERSNQNHAADREIGELKKRYRQKMIKKGAPKRLWDYGFFIKPGS